MKKMIYLPLIFSLLIFSCKDKDEIGPQDPDAPISASIGDEVFNGSSVEKSNKLGFVLIVRSDSSSITIGTNWPPAPGTYSLDNRDPFNGKHYFASYVDGGENEYRTRDGSGTLNISSVRVENDDVKEMKGTFSFTGYSPIGEEIVVENGLINYRE